jgi:hypothetical protein
MEGHVEGGNYILDSLSATVATKFSNLKTNDSNPMVMLNAFQKGRGGYKLQALVVLQIRY